MHKNPKQFGGNSKGDNRLPQERNASKTQSKPTKKGKAVAKKQLSKKENSAPGGGFSQYGGTPNPNMQGGIADLISKG